MEPEGTDWQLRQQVSDTYDLSRVGGYLYLFGWAVVAWLAGAWRFAPGLTLAAGAIFLLLGYLRWAARPPGAAGDAALRRWLRRYSLLLPTSSLAWAGVQAWILLDPRFGQDVRMVSLVATIGYATVFANVYSTVRRVAAAGVFVLFLPVLVLLWLDPGQRALAVAMGFYAVYLAAAVVRSHAEYTRRLRLDLALREQRDLYERLSITDALTGLHNRRHFARRLDDLARDAGDGGSRFALLILDLDHFKQVNDRHGHSTGDACLQALAARLRQAYGAGPGRLARLGGEEFGVLLEDVLADEALGAAEAFRADLVSRPLEAGGQRLAVTVSVGVAVFDPRRHQDGDDLYREADEALYEAKRGGRDRVEAAAAVARR